MVDSRPNTPQKFLQRNCFGSILYVLSCPTVEPWRVDSDLDGTISIVAPVSVKPIPMAPVGSRVIGVPIRTIVIPAWVIGRSVKDRKWDRYWQTETEEDPGLRLGFSQKGDSKDHRQYDSKFFHIVADEKN